MRNYKKVFGITALSLLAVSLASCEAGRNQNVPLTSSTIDFKSNYASVSNNGSDYSVTYEQVYNKFRSNGYGTVLSQMKKAIVSKEMKEATYEKNVKAYNEAIIAAIFGTSSIDTFKNLHEYEIEDYEEKVDDFITSEYDSYGYVLDQYASQFKALIKELATKDDFNYSISWPSELIEQNRYGVALLNLSRTYLENVVDKEKTYSYSEKKNVTNSYYIDDEALESAYKSTYYKYNRTKAIVVKFKTEAEANKYFELNNTTFGNLTKGNSREWYVSLYNLYNKDKKSIDPTDPFNDDNEEQTVFFTDEKNTQLVSQTSSDIAEFIYDHLDNGSYLETPRNIDGNYAMIYREDVTYYYGDGTANDWSSVKNITVDALGNKLVDYKNNEVSLANYIKGKKIEGQASQSLGESLITDKLKYNSQIEIYDPIFENQFYNSYEDYYTLTKNFDGSKIFKITYTDDNFTPEDKNDDTVNEAVTYSVDEFFNEMDKIHGIDYATTLIEYEYLYSSDLKNLFTKSQWNTYEDNANSQINDFKKNNTAYSSKMGLNNYLALTYGITVEKDAKESLTKYLRQQALATSLQTYYGYFIGETLSTTTGSNFVDDNNLFTNFAQFTKNIYNKYYDMSVNHILISVDPKSNGTHVNPINYMEDLAKVNTSLVDEFKEAVYVLANLIYGELANITAKSTTAMSFLAKTYNNVAYSYTLTSQYAKDNNYTTWEDFKNKYSAFNFYLTAEDLGQITSSSSSNYVEEFRDYLKDLADEIESNPEVLDKEGNEKKMQDVIADDGAYLVKEASYDELCLTQYGYHILNVYAYTQPASAKFSETDDSIVNDSQWKRYQHKEVTISEKSSKNTKDDLIVYASGYSNEDAPSAEQLFIYFYESSSSTGVKSMKSSLATAVKTYFTDVMSRYSNSSFQTYRLLQQTLGFANYDANKKTFTSITFYNTDRSTSSEKADKFVKYVKKIRIACDNGDELEETSEFYGWFDKNWTSDLTKCSYFHYDD